MATFEHDTDLIEWTEYGDLLNSIRKNVCGGGRYSYDDKEPPTQPAWINESTLGCYREPIVKRTIQVPPILKIAANPLKTLANKRPVAVAAGRSAVVDGSPRQRPNVAGSNAVASISRLNRGDGLQKTTVVRIENVRTKTRTTETKPQMTAQKRQELCQKQIVKTYGKSPVNAPTEGPKTSRYIRREEKRIETDRINEIMANKLLNVKSTIPKWR